jgi:hypothetical protein
MPATNLVGFGDYRGSQWRDVPTSYLMWILSPEFHDHHDAKVNARIELARRTGFVQNHGSPNSQPIYTAQVREAGDTWEPERKEPDILTEREVFLICKLASERYITNSNMHTFPSGMSVLDCRRKSLNDTCHECFTWPDAESIERMMSIMRELSDDLEARAQVASPLRSRRRRNNRGTEELAQDILRGMGVDISEENEGQPEETPNDPFGDPTIPF